MALCQRERPIEGPQPDEIGILVRLQAVLRGARRAVEWAGLESIELADGFGLSNCPHAAAAQWERD